MTKIRRDFSKGRMDKSSDERIIGNGSYIDAMNIRVGSTEDNSAGIIENVMGNTKLTSLTYNGSVLSNSAKAIGFAKDESKGVLYWFVHDPKFSSSAPKVVDMIVSFNIASGNLSYMVVSVNDGSAQKTTLNFSSNYLISNCAVVDDLLFFTDNLNPPRVIDTTKSYGAPVAGVDGFSAESILVIKKPPLSAPELTLFSGGTVDDFLEDKFVCFAYRYRYDGDQYSAISQFSPPAFKASQFSLDANDFLNNGMKNSINSVTISYNSGGSLVKGIDILFKEMGSNDIKVVAKIDKLNSGKIDDTIYSYAFDSRKVFTILPQSELLRLFDNVPLLAKTQTSIGGRIVYGSYIDGYELTDSRDLPVNMSYKVSSKADDAGVLTLGTSKSSGSYTIYGDKEIADSILNVDFSGIEFLTGSSVNIQLSIIHDSFSGPTVPSGSSTPLTNLSFSVFLTDDYKDAYEFANSKDMKDAVGLVSTIKTVQSEFCDGIKWTDIFNCSLPAVIEPCSAFDSGVNSAKTPILVQCISGSSFISFQIPVMRYNHLVTASSFFYEYYKIVSSSASFQELSNPKSLHSNRGYEVGIVYMDEFLRSTIALTSEDNIVHIPCSQSDKKNTLLVEIPTSQVAPSWATKYKFVIKQDKGLYESIYSTLFFKDVADNSVYFLLDGENAQKIEVGDKLIVKADSNGPVSNLVYATVLEKEAKVSNFIDDSTPSPSGVYMKIKAGGFSTEVSDDSIIAIGKREDKERSSGRAPIVNYPLYKTTYDIDETPIYSNHKILAGSVISISLKCQRLGEGSGDGACERRIYTLEKTFIAKTEYANAYEWWMGENVSAVIDDGVKDVGGTDNCDISNEFTPLIHADLNDMPEDLCVNHFRFGNEDGTAGRLCLQVSGTIACSGVSLYPSKVWSTVSLDIKIYQSTAMMVFETDPSKTLSDIFFEGDESFQIGVDGSHYGNVQNQSFNEGIPARLELGFFNCFTFGNGAESCKMRDSLSGATLSFGNRVTSTSAKDYGKVRRYADLTYSGPHNDETNVNRLNEFNMGLLNFKHLDPSFGEIQVIDGREGDMLVLQEDRISYVLVGKNLISDSVEGGVISSVPEVLGTQISRPEVYGIGRNPESYCVYGADRFFVDANRGVVIMIKGNSYGSDAISVISDVDMGQWFRDNLRSSAGNIKVGGYDPTVGEYVLSLTDEALPEDVKIIPCDQDQLFTVPAGGSVSFVVDLGYTTGVSTIKYGAVFSDSTAVMTVSYNGTDTIVDDMSEGVSVDVTKGSVIDRLATVKIESDGGGDFSLNASSVVSEDITVFSICLSSNYQEGKTIHNEYSYIVDEYRSPEVTTKVSFLKSDNFRTVSSWNELKGAQGVVGVPTETCVIRLVSRKLESDSFVITMNTNDYHFRMLKSDTLYSNNQEDVDALIASSYQVWGVVNPSDGVFYADFGLDWWITGKYLYLIWDYTEINQENLSYGSTESLACCSATSSFYIDSPLFKDATWVRNSATLTDVADDGYYSDGLIVRRLVNGVLMPSSTCSGCTGTACEDAYEIQGAELKAFILDVNVEDGIGAAVLNISPVYAVIGVDALFDNKIYNTLYSGIYGKIESVPDLPVFVGEVVYDCGIAPGSPELQVLSYSGGAFKPTGSSIVLDILESQIKTTPVSPGLMKLVIPRYIGSESVMRIRVYAICSDTNFDYHLDCPELLPVMNCSYLRADTVGFDRCTAASIKSFYRLPVVGSQSAPAVGDVIFMDGYGVTPMVGPGSCRTADGWVHIDINGVIDEIYDECADVITTYPVFMSSIPGLVSLGYACALIEKTPHYYNGTITGGTPNAGSVCFYDPQGVSKMLQGHYKTTDGWIWIKEYPGDVFESGLSCVPLVSFVFNTEMKNTKDQACSIAYPGGRTALCYNLTDGSGTPGAPKVGDTIFLDVYGSHTLQSVYTSGFFRTQYGVMEIGADSVVLSIDACIPPPITLTGFLCAESTGTSLDTMCDQTPLTFTKYNKPGPNGTAGSPSPGDTIYDDVNGLIPTPVSTSVGGYLRLKAGGGMYIAPNNVVMQMYPACPILPSFECSGRLSTLNNSCYVGLSNVFYHSGSTPLQEKPRVGDYVFTNPEGTTTLLSQKGSGVYAIKGGWFYLDHENKIFYIGTSCELLTAFKADLTVFPSKALACSYGIASFPGYFNLPAPGGTKGVPATGDIILYDAYGSKNLGELYVSAPDYATKFVKTQSGTIEFNRYGEITVSNC